jgi:hypothetical protein
MLIATKFDVGDKVFIVALKRQRCPTCGSNAAAGFEGSWTPVGPFVIDSPGVYFTRGIKEPRITYGLSLEEGVDWPKLDPYGASVGEDEAFKTLLEAEAEAARRNAPGYIYKPRYGFSY